MSSKIFCGDQKQSGKNIEQFPRYFTKRCFFRPLKKKTLGDFLVENFPIFPIQNIPEYVFKTLLWGPEPIRKKYWAVFEIFTKIMIFSTFFSKKTKTLGDFWVQNFPIFPIRNIPEYVLKTLLWGPKTIRKKYWAVFEIFRKRLFFSTSKWATRVPSTIHHPPSTIHHIKNRGRPKRTITSSKFKVKKHLL